MRHTGAATGKDKDMTLNKLIAEYAPYDTQIEFKEGFVDYQLGLAVSCHQQYFGLAAIAYAKGYECAMRWSITKS